MRVAIGLGVLCLNAGLLGAQVSASRRAGDRFLGVWAGASFHSPVGTRLGVTPGRDLYLAGVRATYVLESLGPFALAYTGDVLPVAVVSDNPEYGERSLTDARGKTLRFTVQTGRGPVYGAGLSPAGLELSLGLGRRARAFAAGAVGALWFAREMPVRNASRFNVTFEFGGGLEVSAGDRRSLLLGYKFHHLSNAYSAPRNPGLDGHVYYLGMLHRRGSLQARPRTE